MRGRYLAVVGGGVAIAILILVSCTDLSGLTADDAGSEVGQGESSPPAPDPPPPAPPFDDAGQSDGRIDAAALEAGCCDCDNDGYRNDASCSLGADASLAFDCDDLDPAIHPEAGYIASSWTSPHKPAGDWNCDGVVEKQLPVNISCSGGGCFNVGFSGDPPCGIDGDYLTCAACIPTHTTKTQACR